MGMNTDPNRMDARFMRCLLCAQAAYPHGVCGGRMSLELVRELFDMGWRERDSPTPTDEEAQEIARQVADTAEQLLGRPIFGGVSLDDYETALTKALVTGDSHSIIRWG